MGTCQVDGCTEKLARADHKFCRAHWKADVAGALKRCAICNCWHEASSSRPHRCTVSDPGEDESPEDTRAGLLSSTKIAKHFGLSNMKVNLILAELGWIEKCGPGWAPTDRGNALGANIREKKKPFVLWPASILKNPALLASIAEQSPRTASPRPAQRSSDDFRKKFVGDYCAVDGHLVKSRAELLIDNWLYMQGLIHAYERRLPIEEDCYCDFYLPNNGKGVYIEYWGRESDQKYRERMTVKKALYAKHNLQLIELGDAEIERLDDVLPKELLRFGIECL